MKQKNYNNKQKRLLIIATVLVIIAAAFALYKYSGKDGSVANRIPGIDYSPAKPSDNEANDKAKQSDSYGQDPGSPNTTDSNLGITFAAAGQDTDGGDVTVKVLLQNITDGVCHLTLKQGQAVVERTVNIVRQSNYYTCDGFNIPFSQVQVGSAQLTLTVNATNGATNYATKDITIK